MLNQWLQAVKKGYHRDAQDLSIACGMDAHALYIDLLSFQGEERTMAKADLEGSSS